MYSTFESRFNSKRKNVYKTNVLIHFFNEIRRNKIVKLKKRMTKK